MALVTSTEIDNLSSLGTTIAGKVEKYVAMAEVYLRDLKGASWYNTRQWLKYVDGMCACSMESEDVTALEAAQRAETYLALYFALPHLVLQFADSGAVVEVEWVDDGAGTKQQTRYHSLRELGASREELLWQAKFLAGTNLDVGYRKPTGTDDDEKEVVEVVLARGPVLTAVQTVDDFEATEAVTVGGAETDVAVPVELWDVAEGSGDTLAAVVRSPDNDMTLGSAAGADANDPSWSTLGLTFGADEQLTDVPLKPRPDWTVLVGTDEQVEAFDSEGGVWFDGAAVDAAYGWARNPFDVETLGAFMGEIGWLAYYDEILTDAEHVVIADRVIEQLEKRVTDWGDDAAWAAVVPNATTRDVLAALTSPVTSKAELEALTGTFDLSGTAFTDLRGLWLATGVTNFILSGVGLVGSIPATWADLSALTSLQMQSNELSGSEAGAFATQTDLTNLDLASNVLTQAAVDQILADLVVNLNARDTFTGFNDSNPCTVDLSGNKAPSADGEFDASTLRSASWTVTTD